MSFNLGSAEGDITLTYNKRGGAQAAEADLDRLEKKAKKTGFTLDDVGKTSGRAGLAIAAGIGAAVFVAATFEKRISAIGAVSGATAGELEKIRQKALQLGKDTSFSASEAATAMEELVKAGLSVDEVLNGAADATVALAAAGEIDLPQAATIASNAMNQFNLSAKDLPRVADLIAGAANASAIDVSEFGMSLSQAGAAANLAGITFDDLSAAIALMGNAGIKGSDAGTSLKTMLLNLNPATDKQTTLFKKLGLITKDGANQFFDAAGNAKSMSQIAGVLAESLKGMTKQQKLANLEVLFGSDAIRAAAVVAGAGSKGFDQMSASMGKVKAADVAKQKLDNLSGSFEALKGSVETLAITMGTILIPAIRDIVDKFSELVNWFLELSPETQKTVVAVTAAAGAFLLLSSGLIRVVAFAGKLAATIKVILGLKLVATILLNLRVAFVVLTAAVRAFTVSLLTNPVFLIIAGIIALGAAIFFAYKKFEPFRNVVDAVGRALRDVFLGAVRGVVAAFHALVGAFKSGEATQGGLLGFFQKLGVVARFTWEMMKILANFFMAHVWPVLKIIGQIIGTVVVTAFQIWINYIKILWTVWSAVFTAIKNIVLTVFPPILAVIRTVILGIFNVIKVTMTAALAFWRGVWNLFGPLVRAVIGLIVSIVKLGIALVVLAFKVGMAVASAVVRTSWALISGAFKAGFNVVKSVVNAIKTNVIQGWNVIRAGTVAVWNVVRSAVTSAINAVRTAVTGAVNTVKSIVTGAWNAIKNITSTIWGALPGTVREKINAVVEAVRALPGRIVGFFSNAGGLLLQAGRDIIRGLIEGITSQIGALKSKLDSLTSMIPDLKGPEQRDKKLLYDSGQLIMQGLLRGISSEIPHLRSLLTGVTFNVVPGAAQAGMAVPGSASPSMGASIVYDVDVHNPPPVPGERQVIEALRRMESLYHPTGVLNG